MMTPKTSFLWRRSVKLPAGTQVELAELKLVARQQQVKQQVGLIQQAIQQQIRQPESLLWAFGAGFVAERLGRPSLAGWSWQKLLNDSLYWYQLWSGFGR